MKLRTILAGTLAALGISFAAWALGQNFKIHSQSFAIATDQVGTAGSPAADTLSVQGVSGGTPQVIGGRGFNNADAALRVCDKTANLTTLGTTATVQQIAAVASQNIYVCGIVLTASTATAGTTISLVEGTGSNCATGAATVGGLLGLTPTAVPTTPNLVLSPGPGARVTATAGDALCIQQGQAVNSTALTGLIFYTQG